METSEMINVMQAYDRGEVIEYRDKDEWIPVKSVTDWRWVYTDYRVKPKQSYRPYKNAEEFLQAQKEHGIYMVEKNIIDGRKEYEIPTTVCDEFVTFVLPCTCNGNDMHSISYNYENLLKYKVWQDETPCGVLE